MQTPNPGDVIRVKWIDSEEMTSGWTSKKELDRWRDGHEDCDSVGFYHHQDDNWLYMYSSDSGSGDMLGALRIPLVSIRELVIQGPAQPEGTHDIHPDSNRA